MRAQLRPGRRPAGHPRRGRAARRRAGCPDAGRPPPADAAGARWPRPAAPRPGGGGSRRHYRRSGAAAAPRYARGRPGPAGRGNAPVPRVSFLAPGGPCGTIGQGPSMYEMEGPWLALRSWGAGCPAPRPCGRHRRRAPVRSTSFPVPRTPPGCPGGHRGCPRQAPVFSGESFLRPCPAAAQEFSRRTFKILRSSTGRRALSPADSGFPPRCPQECPQAPLAQEPAPRARIAATSAGITWFRSPITA